MTELSRAGERICARCTVARSPIRRMMGLRGRRALSSEEGLLLQPSGSAHTWFIRFPIDVVFLDAELRVLRVVEALEPWKVAGMRGAKRGAPATGGCGRAGAPQAGRRAQRGLDEKAAEKAAFQWSRGGSNP